MRELGLLKDGNEKNFTVLNKGKKSRKKSYVVVEPDYFSYRKYIG